MNSVSLHPIVAFPTSGCVPCPVEGGVGWQGPATGISSTWESEIASITEIEKVTYSFGTLWADERVGGGRRFEYVARKDCGCLDRHGSFSLSPTTFFPRGYRARHIQQTSSASYPKYCLAPKRFGKAWSTVGLTANEIKKQCTKVIAYDRGHVSVNALRFDHILTDILSKSSWYLPIILTMMHNRSKNRTT